MTTEEIKQGILSTGFKLEFDISNQLAAHGWTVINNKYYIDDLQESVREIDLLAYRSSVVQHFRVYTFLLISCKKSEENNWALLAKEIDFGNPNYDWLPVHAWSNDPALCFELNEADWRDEYFKTLKAQKATVASTKPKRHIFAFQEMNKATGKPKNDRNIFNSVVSLIKAQAYEMSALPNRIANPRVYQFNLASIVDSELYRIDFSDDEVEPKKVSEEVYVVGYIVNKEQTVCRVHFINAEKFDAQLSRYDKLHQANLIAFGRMCDSFYENVFSAHRYWSHLYSDFVKDLDWNVGMEIRKTIGKSVSLDGGWFYLDKKDKGLELAIDVDEEDAKLLEQNGGLKKNIAKSLKSVYRFEGEFRIAHDPIPF